MLKKDTWLGGLLGKDAWSLDLSDENFSRLKANGAEKTELDKILGENVFVFTKVPTGRMDMCSFLEDTGFRLADTNMTFDLDTAETWIEPENDLLIRDAEPRDRNAVEDIARRNFVYSRFHLDPMIPRETANEIKAQWAGNFFTGKRGDSLLVAEDDGKITGFVQLIETAAAAIIDLIAVDSSQRGKGTATSLISGLMLKHGNKARIIVGTQAANIPSMRLYQKCGFRLTGSKYIFHYHNKSKI